MSFWLIAIGYVLCGVLTSRLARNVILNHYYREQLKSRERAIEITKRSHDYKQEKRNYRHELVEDLENCKHEEALKQAYYDADTAISFGTVLGFFYWPAMLIILGIRATVLFVRNVNLDLLPKSKAERQVKKLVSERLTAQIELDKLKIDHAALLKLAEEADLDTRGLQLIERARNTSSKS